MTDSLDDQLAQLAAIADQRQTLQPPAARPFAGDFGPPSGPPQPAAAPGQSQANPSIFQRVGRWFGDTWKANEDPHAGETQLNQSLGAVTGILRAPGQLVGGALDTLADAGKFVDHNMQSPWVRSAVSTLDAAGIPTQGLMNLGTKARAMNGGASLADTLSARESLGQIGDTKVNQLSAEASGIAATLPFGGEGAAPEAAGVLSRVLAGTGRVLVNSAKVGAATAVVADPRSTRIANLIQNAGVHDAFIDYLAGDDSDPDLVKRFKGGIEGAIGNAALEPLFMGVGAGIKAALAGDAKGAAAAVGELPAAPENTIAEATPLEGAADRLDRTFATGRTQEARYQAAEAQASRSMMIAPEGQAPASAEAAPGLNAANTANPAQPSATEPATAPSGTPTEGQPTPAPSGQSALTTGTRQTDAAPLDPAAKVAADANALLSKAGLAERVDPEAMDLTPDGRIRVDPKTKAALDDQGLGRAFAAADETAADRILYKETDPEGGSRVVGSLDRDGVQAFADRVADLRDAALDAKDPNVLDVRHGGPSGDVLQTAETAARSGEWKVASLGAPYDVAPTIRALIDQVPATGRPKTDADLMAQARAVYDTVGIDPQTALQYASGLAGKTRDLDTALVVVRTLWADAARALDDVTGMDVSTMSKDAQQDAAERIHHAMMLSLDMSDTKAGIGRAQRAMQLPDLQTYLDNYDRTPEPQLAPKGVGELPPLPRNAQELQQWLDLWGAMKADPVARQRFLEGLTFVPGKWAYLRNSLPNFYVASLVSAPTTFARDLIGPAIVGALRTVERTAGGYAASLNPWISPATRSELLATATQAPAAYLRTVSDIGDAFKYALQAVRQGHSVLGGANPIDFTATRIPRAMIDAAMAKTGPGVTGDIPYVLGNLINLWPQAVHALHGGVNEFAQRLAYNGEIRAQAMVDAAQAGLTDPQDIRRFVLDKLDAAGDPLTGQATNGAALASSQRTTFTQPVGGGDTMRAFAKWIQDAKTNTPELTYLLPIFRVPANAIGETIRRIPVVGQMLSETRNELSGSLGATAQAEAYGRFLSGAALMTAGFTMARNGSLTRAGPSDPAARQLWLTTHQPYAIRIGGQWVGYNRLDVVGQMLGIMGSSYDRSVYHAQDNGNAIFAGVGALSQYFKDQAALQGVANLMSFGGEPNADQGALARLTQGIASGFVPNFITQLARNNADANARVVHGETLDTGTEAGIIPALGGAVHSLADGAWKAVLNKLPGGSATLDPQRNLLGEDVYKARNAGWNTLPISLSNVNTYAKDPVLDELSRLYEATGYAPGIPSASAGKGHFDQRDVVLEDGHSLQDALLRHRMTTTIDGQTLRQALTAAITSDDYLLNAVDGTGRRQTDDGQLTRADILGKIFTAYDKAARQETAQESPIAARWLAVADAKDQDNPALSRYSAQQLATQPALLRALNVPIAAHEAKVRGDFAGAF